MSEFIKNAQAKVDLGKEKPVPRSVDEINKNYQDVCTALGDKQVKSRGLEQEIEELFKYVQSLGNELAARQELDSKAKAEAQSQVAVEQESLAPVTTGVDAT